MLSEPFKTYSRHLRQLHTSIRSGAGESAAADEVRDRMDRPWAMLTSAEQELTRFLSADLYDLAKQPAPPESLKTARQRAANQLLSRA